MKKILLTLLVLILIGGVYVVWKEKQGQIDPSPNDGRVASIEDLITVDTPLIDSLITSPVTITGEARGMWFFEASFPVSLVNWDGLIIAQGVATAQGEWMTEDFVPFTAVLEFEKPTLYPERGALILQKDNPSGLPEHDAALEIPIRFE